MDPYLMGSTGFSVNFKQGVTIKILLNRIARSGLPAAIYYRHTFTIRWVTPDRSLDNTLVRSQLAFNQYKVTLGHRPGLELINYILLGGAILGNNYQP